MLNQDDSRDARDQERAQRTAPPVPNRAQQRRKNKTHYDREQMDVTMLPTNERVPLQIGDVIEWRIGFHFEQEPADMRIPKSFRDAVGIVVVVIDEFVMTPMFARPHHD